MNISKIKGRWLILKTVLGGVPFVFAAKHPRGTIVGVETVDAEQARELIDRLDKVYKES